MKALSVLVRALVLCGLALLSACSDQSVVATLRSLSGSEDVVFLCKDANGVGHPYADCPDRDINDDDDPAKRLSVVALVSQTVTDEVAVIDVSAGHVVDVDPSTPGYGFLRVGGRPISMAVTPGGMATFVATADVGRNGIFALPTSCLSAPVEGAPQLDLTSWSACRLDETPGEMAVMVEPSPTDPASLADGGRGQCVVAPYDETDAPPLLLDREGNPRPGVCPADLRADGGATGRRKLVVALPDSSRLAVIDAQSLLNKRPGTFPPCQIESFIPLKVDVPAGVAQTLPADLASTCGEVAAPTAPPPSKHAPQPAGFAVSDDRLYIADQAAPVIHVLDTTSVCGMTELPSLLPMSLREPQRVVTTRRVAVSPLTPAGQRFAYAIDSEDQPGASVMVFDVSPGATDKTPIVRTGSPELPGEKPDRLALAASAKDVTFAYRDIPYVDPATGAAQFGVRCDPDPTAPANTPGVLARPSSDLLTGARPGLLRGLFGFILLTNGSIAVVDVDDFDADCRRPIAANHSALPDFRGCSGDKIAGDFFALDPTKPELTATVTDEVSCRIVEPNRFRSSRLVVNNSTVGVRAPSLRGFPQLTLPASAVASAVEDRPRLLAVPFEGPGGDLDVFVGSTAYNTSPTAANVLPTDPNGRGSDLNQSLQSVVLPPLEPRSYAAEDTVTLTYEGSYAGERTAGFLQDGPQAQQAVLVDGSLSFCDAGVYSQALMQDYAQQELGLDKAADVAAFADAHADYVQLTTPFPLATDSYWSALKSQDSHALSLADCVGIFGAEDAETLAPARDFRIVSATAFQLVIEPRPDIMAMPVSMQAVRTCFPAAQQYRLRAGAHWVLLHSAFGFRHDVIASGADSACVRSCNPLKKWTRGRVFEISSQQSSSSDPTKPACRAADAAGAEAAGDPLDLRVGCAADGEVACVYDQTQTVDNGNMQMVASATLFGTRAAKCIFNGLNDRFALYRGRVPSVRDAVFTWQTTGGFTPLVMSLAAVSTVVSPQSIQFLPGPEQVAVVDGSSQGLSLFSLDTFSIVSPSPFY